MIEVEVFHQREVTYNTHIYVFYELETQILILLFL